MIFFVANDGTIIKGMPSPVYQGAANSNTIYLIAPFASNTAVAVAFRLPNGVVTSPAAMTAQNALQGIVNAETGQTYAGWTYDLPNGITEMFGTVTVQFFFYSAEAGVITPTSSTSFEVGRGVPAVLPDTPEDDVYENILSNLAALQTQLNNGSFASRAIYNWNASYTYGAGEVTFYPDIGTYGAFVKSVQAGNTNHAPYTDGAVNSAWWSEVVNFNTVTDDFFAEIKAVQTAAEAAQSAAETAQGKAEAAQARAEEAESGAQTQAQAAASSATAAEGSAVQAQTNAGEASASATAAAESAAAASGSESAAAEAAGSASKSAGEAAASAGEAASSASSAQAAQAAAEKAKESVEASADAAAKSAESARASATAAGNSATAAAGSASTAESAKTAAQTAQNAAESAEGNAQAYAGQASGSASAASQSEINARAYMEQAKQYAQKEYQVVESFDDLPRPGDSAYIYLVPSGSGSSNDHYSEYLWISEGNDYEFVGAINEVDLSGYAQTNGTYPNMTVGNASNAASAQTAVKATQDAAGNDIAATYAKQTGTYAGMTVGNATQAGSANDPSAVHFTAQTLTDEQKAQARTNIGAADAGTVATNTSDIADLESDVQKIIDGTTSVAEAAHADTADSATKAAQDAAGNVIADTYAKQQGSYPQMSVGNASNATLASNSNKLGGVAAASYALKQNSSGGFAGGNGASTLAGAAVGNGATAAAGFAGGDHASTTGAGGAAGSSATTTNGGAVGNGASSTTGFAGGQASNTTTGAAIGTSAVASGAGAVQLGTGNNAAANTLQFRSYPLVDANGNISPARLLDMYPVGSYYITESSTTPASLFGGSWVRVSNSFLYGAASQSAVGQTGGEADHVLTIDEMPNHAHKPHGYTWITSQGANSGDIEVTRVGGRNAFGIEFMQDYDQNRYTSYTGGGAAHNNLPPYRRVNLWRRTA